MNTFKVDCIEDAVALAERFKQEGKYDLLRGQRANWPVSPTLARLDDEGRRVAGERLKLFFAWVQDQPELTGLADRQDPRTVDQKYAVAQHYGIPTSFCDFTTEPTVAGFFASSTDARGDGTSVIVCCDSSDLVSATRMILPLGYPQPEILRITVPNLWRLAAQAGVFLFLPYPKFEEFYDFDRILFPAGSYQGVSPENIYPTRRSPLEVLLDQFFRTEQEVAHHEAVVSRASEMVVRVSPGAADRMKDSLVDGDPGVHPSWLEAAPEWNAYRVERWSHSRDVRPLEMISSLGTPATEIREEIRERVLCFCRAHEAARHIAIRLTAGDGQFQPFVERLQMVWDGIRCYPYSHEEVADAVANAAFLGKSILEVPEPARWSRPNEDAAKALWNEPLQVVFGRPGTAAATGYVDGTALKTCVRPDLLKLLKPEYRKRADHSVNIVNMIPVPSRAYVFRPFAAIYVTQVVPSQVILFRSLAHYFSPTQLGAFGLP